MMDRLGDPRGRGIRPRRLSARRRGDADRRTRRAAMPRSIIWSNAVAEIARSVRRHYAARVGIGSTSACCSGRAARRPFRRWAAFRPTIYCMDGTIPRAKLPLVLRAHVGAVARSTACGSPTCSMPATAICIRSILYDANKPGELERAEAFGADILQAMRRSRRRADRRARRRRREARPDAGDVFARPISISSSGSNARSTTRACSIPAKSSRRCTAARNSGRMHVHGGRVPFPDIPRF